MRERHGLSNTRLYRIWLHIKTRCNNSKYHGYKYYGGRNITICKEWNSFLSFYNWSMENKYNDNLSIDRINNDGNYEPSNCRWATNKEQSNNKRFNNQFGLKLFKAIKLLDNYEEISNNQHEFARKYNLQQSNIKSCLKKQGRKKHKGWIFEYIQPPCKA